MVVVHKQFTPAKEEMSYSIIATSENSSKARVMEDINSGYQSKPSGDDTIGVHECNVYGQRSLTNCAKCEGVYKPIFESSWPPSEYVGKKINCRKEPMPPEEEFSAILVDEEIDEFEHDYLPEDDDCQHCGKLSRNNINSNNS